MRVTSIADNDAVNSFTWDIMGRLLTTTNAGTTNATPVVLTNSYDSLGRRSGLAATINSVADFVNTYSYDTASRMTKITQTDGNSSAGDAIKDKRVDLSYDSIGRFTSIARYESLNTTNPIASTAFSYDSAGHLTSLQHTGFTIVSNASPDPFAIAGYSYTWDAADRLTSMNSVKDGLSTYSYDTTDQITAADHTGQSDESFTYDANGNRISVLPGSPDPAATVTTHNRILNDGTSTYTYDAEGNRTSKTDIATGHKVEYSWNHANQLIAVVYKTYNNTVTKSVECQYDALGRRIGKSVDDNGDSTMDRRETLVYDGAGLLADAAGSIHIGGPNGALNQAGWTDQLLFQFTDADADGTSSSPIATRFFTGPAVDQIFAVESASGDPLWALIDHQGTPRDWVQQTTINGNSATISAQHVQYTAFGAISFIVDASGNLLDASLVPLSSFTGQLYDADADLMYYRARWYDPVLGKFLNDDPMGFGAGDANVSRYVGNRSVSRADATGMEDRELTQKEKQAIEYLYRSVYMPEWFPLICETTTEVHLWNGNESWNPIVLANMKEGCAITLGTNQYYEDFPRPDDIWELPLLAHETMHTFHGQSQTRPEFVTLYALEGVWAGVAYGSPYHGITTEVEAYAIGQTMQTMLQDPDFRNAVKNGTTHLLDPSYHETILKEYYKQLEEQQKKYQTVIWTFPNVVGPQ